MGPELLQTGWKDWRPEDLPTAPQARSQTSAMVQQPGTLRRPIRWSGWPLMLSMDLQQNIEAEPFWQAPMECSACWATTLRPCAVIGPRRWNWSYSTAMYVNSHR